MVTPGNRILPEYRYRSHTPEVFTITFLVTLHMRSVSTRGIILVCVIRSIPDRARNEAMNRRGASLRFVPDEARRDEAKF